MPPQPPAWTEASRLAALQSYAILDTPFEAPFDDLARLASDACDAPIAMVNLVDACRQWFKAEIGLDVRETARSISICTHAIQQAGLFVVQDTTQDPRFASNPLVLGPPHLRFYAGVPLLAAGGLPIGTLCVLDHAPRPAGLTDRQVFALTALGRQVMAQLELRQAASVLEARVQQRTQALEAEQRVREAAQEQLRQAQKMEAVGQLAGGIAHDFNNLLTAVLGGLELMQTRLAQGRTAEAARFATAAIETAKRGSALTSRLLDFSRRHALDTQSVEVDAVVRSLQDLLQRTVGAGVRVETRLSPGLDAALCDPNQLESALLNLVINARDAMPASGRVLISTDAVLLGEADERPVDLPPGRYVRVSVADTGTGMPPEVQARVFEPFFTTKAAGAGTGLGLSMVFGFARQSGGHVSLQSAPGAGTTVTLLLPGKAGLLPGKAGP